MHLGARAALLHAPSIPSQPGVPQAASIALAVARSLYALWDDQRRDRVIAWFNTRPEPSIHLGLPDSFKVPSPEVLAEPSFLLGSLYEGMIGAAGGDTQTDAPRSRRNARKCRGAYYTPPDVVVRAIELLGPISPQVVPLDRPLTICDPACGSGNFLARAARIFGERARMGVDLFGCDLDPEAAELARAALDIERAMSPRAPSAPRWAHAIHVGDALVGRVCPPDLPSHADPRGCEHDPDLERAVQTIPMPWIDHIPREPGADRHPQGVQGRGFDILLANPPYLSQLSSLTTRSRALAAYLRHASGGLIEGYADGAAAFLWRSIHLTRPGGSLCLVLPHTLLCARDAAPLRAFVERETEIIAIEPVRAGAFDAGVSPVLLAMRRRDRSPGSRGSAGGATPRARTASTLADIATAIADFRDEYYGLLPYVIDDPDNALEHEHFPPIISCGLIDPGTCLWGRKPARLYKRVWARPRADLRAMGQDQTRSAWARRRLVPKVLLATQTRTLECWADTEGVALPVTPVISIFPKPGHTIEEIMSVLQSPQALMEARRMGLGAGLTPHVIKLSARQALQLPR